MWPPRLTKSAGLPPFGRTARRSPDSRHHRQRLPRGRRRKLSPQHCIAGGGGGDGPARSIPDPSHPRRASLQPEGTVLLGGSSHPSAISFPLQPAITRLHGDRFLHWLVQKMGQKVKVGWVIFTGQKWSNCHILGQKSIFTQFCLFCVFSFNLK